MNEDITNSSVSLSSTARSNVAPKMIIFPVSVLNKEKGKTQKVFAFADSGSSRSYITKKLARALDASGPEEILRTETFNGPMSMKTERITGIKIKSVDDDVGDYEVELKCLYTKDKIPVEQEHIPRSCDFKQYPHMNVLKRYDNFEGEIGLMF